MLEAFDMGHYDVCGRSSMLLNELFYTLSDVLVPESEDLLSNSRSTELDEFTMLNNPSREDSIQTMLYLRDSILFHDKIATSIALRALVLMPRKDEHCI